MPTLDNDAIRAILPHRYPFLLVDRIIEMDEKHIVGIKNVTANEPFSRAFSGFPGDARGADYRSDGADRGRSGASSIPDRQTTRLSGFRR